MSKHVVKVGAMTPIYKLLVEEAKMRGDVMLKLP